jgi:hypothetical protein
VQFAAPIAKGMFLFVIILVLPLVGMVSKYSLGIVLSIHMMIFSVLLWPVLWEVVMLLQQSYWETVYEDNLFGLVNLDELNSKMLITLFTDALFVILPMALTAFLTMAGMKGGAELNHSMAGGNAGKVGGDAGKGGASQAGSTAKKTGSKVVKAASSGKKST